MKSHSLKLLFFFVAVFASFMGQAQQPVASPAQKVSGKAGAADITINYGSPAVKGRTIWGDLVPYDKVWRAGANEATTIETSKDITVEGKTLPAGKYAFFTIPGKDKWTVIFNKEAKQWGAYSYKEAQDALRVQVTPRKAASFNERLAYVVNKDGFAMRWADLEVPVTVK
ncbi:Protein of unknown function [Cnuella takakiae]|uniref:DUF2911 domain-containing protein n=1 Tax=Cnuella takakiae TaxID=1302690 RepID=A0A1M5ESZ4_9BACT|nr:DUF2911 domain-containing protein [Cnuella takakiae]OLY91288.1 hypothetical protein BUE76_04760 [Cnuella takakiae]SHF82270.1 Protein of unknown function [Cnuella takakiae]